MSENLVIFIVLMNQTCKIFKLETKRNESSAKSLEFESASDRRCDMSCNLYTEIKTRDIGTFYV